MLLKDYKGGARSVVISPFFPSHAPIAHEFFSQKFGELRTITRMPNGDLHVDFKRTEVADTVSAVFHRRRAILSESDMGWL